MSLFWLLPTLFKKKFLKFFSDFNDPLVSWHNRGRIFNACCLGGFKFRLCYSWLGFSVWLWHLSIWVDTLETGPIFRAFHRLFWPRELCHTVTDWTLYSRQDPALSRMTLYYVLFLLIQSSICLEFTLVTTPGADTHVCPPGSTPRHICKAYGYTCDVTFAALITWSISCDVGTLVRGYYIVDCYVNGAHNPSLGIGLLHMAIVLCLPSLSAELSILLQILCVREKHCVE